MPSRDRAAARQGDSKHREEDRDTVDEMRRESGDWLHLRLAELTPRP